MAYHHIRAKFLYSPLDSLRKSSAKARNHLMVHVAITRCPIGHFVRHTAYGKRHLVRFEVNRVRTYTSRKRQRIIGGDSANNCGTMTSSDFTTHHFGQIHTAARAIWLLGSNIQDPHCSYIPLHSSPCWTMNRWSFSLEPCSTSQAKPQPAEMLRGIVPKRPSRPQRLAISSNPNASAVVWKATIIMKTTLLHQTSPQPIKAVSSAQATVRTSATPVAKPPCGKAPTVHPKRQTCCKTLDLNPFSFT